MKRKNRSHKEITIHINVIQCTCIVWHANGYFQARKAPISKEISNATIHSKYNGVGELIAKTSLKHEVAAELLLPLFCVKLFKDTGRQFNIIILLDFPTVIYQIHFFPHFVGDLAPLDRDRFIFYWQELITYGSK